MTLHGLMDHADLPNVIMQDRAEVIGRARVFYDALGDHSDSPTLAYASMDLDGNGRLKLSEAVLWTLAATDALADMANETATLEFQHMADGKARLDPSLVKTMGTVQYSANAFDHLFEAIDADRDGMFSLQEYVLFRYPDYSDTLRAVFADRFLDQFDTDKSGSLSLSEFLNGTLVIQAPDASPYSAQSYDYRSERDTVARMFEDSLDTNHSGELEKDELAAILHPAHFSHSVHEAYALFVKCDANGDHELSLQELQGCQETKPFLQRHSLVHVSTTQVVEDVYGRMGQRLRRLGLAHIHDEL
ncbi:hypothetical protein PTSG_02282 [Salpingoeca rosetta]|uniref:EF-hand domain-containing protein n=1 Tax=Salpingoeca rosetta (strain ATCC 50818 / BSB-021) TaxID=946362 RepID=F2U1R5_SALR5|nr:uncharacterized protein PTSG_02282 [Salpingoeca rosetta]EGD81567.1 hypothetical protein PTSG_02282 [Salpingoeca rosetta]|eukprot:XP_004996771.1 hypothetical protein PTSG_02282 [Salpingoeca rosetta]